MKNTVGCPGWLKHSVLSIIPTVVEPQHVLMENVSLTLLLSSLSVLIAHAINTARVHRVSADTDINLIPDKL